MIDSFNNFVELLVRGDFFLIFLIVMMIVIVSVIIYLIKLQISDAVYYDDEDIIEDDEEVISKEDTVIKEELVEEEKTNHLIQEKFDFDNNDMINSIKSFEDEQEELAIISATELEDRLKEMKNSGCEDSHEKEIKEYEEEQENKAIISYEELLKRASQGVISYESEENLDGIRVGKVNTSHIESYSESNDRPYYKEEEFLEALKEFRRAL